MTMDNHPDAFRSIPSERPNSGPKPDQTSSTISVPTILLPCLSLLALTFWDDPFGLDELTSDGTDRPGGGGGWCCSA